MRPSQLSSRAASKANEEAEASPVCAISTGRPAAQAIGPVNFSSTDQASSPYLPFHSL